MRVANSVDRERHSLAPSRLRSCARDVASPASRRQNGRSREPVLGSALRELASVRWIWDQGFDVTGVDFIQGPLEELRERDFPRLSWRKSDYGGTAHWQAERICLIASD